MPMAPDSERRTTTRSVNPDLIRSATMVSEGADPVSSSADNSEGMRHGMKTPRPPLTPARWHRFSSHGSEPAPQFSTSSVPLSVALDPIQIRQKFLQQARHWFNVVRDAFRKIRERTVPSQRGDQRSHCQSQPRQSV